MPRSLSKSSSEELFNALFETYKERLFHYVFTVAHCHYIAEEITQEIFLKLWLNRLGLQEIKNPEAYLFTIARHKLLNYLRKAQYDEKLLADLKSQMILWISNVEERLAFSESERLVQEAVTMLSPQRQLVYQLSRNQGLDHKQIARELQLSRNTVKNHLVHALRFIRGYLNHKGFLFLFFLFFHKYF